MSMNKNDVSSTTEPDYGANSTQKGTTHEEVKKLIPTFGIYAFQGVLLIMTNAPTLITIFSDKVLRTRKGYVIIAGLALADMMNGFGALFAAIGRIRLILAGKALILRSRWECAITSWNLIFYWSNPLGGLMLFVVTLDRFIAVVLPIRYYKLTHRYAYKLLAFTYSYVVLGSLIGMRLTYLADNEPEYISICFTVWGMEPTYLKYQYFLRVGGGFASVVVYIIAYIVMTTKGELFFFIKNKVNNAEQTGATLTDNEQLDLWKKQLQLTATVGISTLFTFVFFVVPYTVEIYANWRQEQNLMFLIPYVYTVNNVNAMLNCFIFAFRQADLRKGFVRVFSRKTAESVVIASARNG